MRRIVCFLLGLRQEKTVSRFARANISGAQVHIWHCNAQGIYSDVQASTNGSGADYSGSNFLRGYQHTDSNGQVSLTTIYPGWYSGRSVHIHIKVRIFDSSGNVTTEATTQLFFADSISTAVYASGSAYSRSGTRDTTNSADGIYNQEDPALQVSLNGGRHLRLRRNRFHRHSRGNDLRRLAASPVARSGGRKRTLT